MSSHSTYNVTNPLFSQSTSFMAMKHSERRQSIESKRSHAQFKRSQHNSKRLQNNSKRSQNNSNGHRHNSKRSQNNSKRSQNNSNAHSTIQKVKTPFKNVKGTISHNLHVEVV